VGGLRCWRTYQKPTRGTAASDYATVMPW
jgi:hypothetical protein